MVTNLILFQYCVARLASIGNLLLSPRFSFVNLHRILSGGRGCISHSVRLVYT